MYYLLPVEAAVAHALLPSDWAYSFAFLEYSRMLIKRVQAWLEAIYYFHSFFWSLIALFSNT